MSSPSATLFPPEGPPADRESAHTIEKGHGRIETRRITVSHEIIYAITSLPRPIAAPEALLTLARDHWGIENRLHWRRDVLLNEDASRIRSSAAPQAMALVRHTMLGIANRFAAPIPAVRMAVAEDRCAAIATVKNAIL